MVVIWHSACQFKMGTIALKSVFHQNTTLGEQIQSGINCGSRDPVAPSVHVQIELVSTEVAVKFPDSVKNVGPLLSGTILLAPEEFGES